MKINVNCGLLIAVLSMIAAVNLSHVNAQEVSIASGPAKIASSMPDYTRYSIRELIANPPARGTKVETYGTTDIVATPKKGKASTFILKGDEGGSITVETNEQLPPVPNTRKDPLYATVQYEPGSDGVMVPFLIVALDVNQRRPEAIVTQVVQSAPSTAIVEKSFIEKNQYPLIAGALVILALIITLTRNNSNKTEVPSYASPANYTPSSQPAPPPPPFANSMQARVVPPYPVPTIDQNDVEDEITIRQTEVVVKVQEEATREFFPLHLVIRSGFGDGTKIPLCSSVGGGRTITIGRRKKGSPKGASFIGLEDDTLALSGQQVKLTYDKASRRVLLENQSAANPSVIDGRSLAAGETLTLKTGMRIALPPNYELEVCEGAHFPFSK
jgi:hypothetical protein